MTSELKIHVMNLRTLASQNGISLKYADSSVEPEPEAYNLPLAITTLNCKWLTGKQKHVIFALGQKQFIYSSRPQLVAAYIPTQLPVCKLMTWNIFQHVRLRALRACALHLQPTGCGKIYYAVTKKMKTVLKD